MNVEWGQLDSKSYPVDILVKAYQYEKFPSDVFAVLAADKVSVIATKTIGQDKSGLLGVRIKIAVASVEALSEICKRIKGIQSIISVERFFK